METANKLAEFEALLEESFESGTPKENTVVNGTIIAIEAGQAIIDIGYKMEGRVDVREFTTSASKVEELKIGDTINVSHFVEGEFVDVSGITKGKGFQGVVKRHGFAGVGQSTHGQHNRLRAPGSIGAASYPARVFKGMRMAGQTGNSKVTVQNLKVLKVVPEKNLLVLKGAVPGHKNSFVIIRK